MEQADCSRIACVPRLVVVEPGLLVVDDREFLCPDAGHVFFGKLRHLFERTLELPVIACDLGIGWIGGNLNLAADSDERLRKRFWDHEVVPRLEDPGIIKGNIESHHGESSGTGKPHRAGLGHIFRTARAINGEGYRSAPGEFFPHSQQRLGAAAAARPAHRHKAERLNNPRDVFAIKAAAHHHCNSLVSPHPGSGEHGPVPEGIDHGFEKESVRRDGLIFPGNGVAQRAADGSDGEIAGPADQPEKKSLPAREGAHAWIGFRRRLQGRRRAHLVILVRGLQKTISRRRGNLTSQQAHPYLELPAASSHFQQQTCLLEDGYRRVAAVTSRFLLERKGH
jgi:hypothetical protein